MMGGEKRDAREVGGGVRGTMSGWSGRAHSGGWSFEGVFHGSCGKRPP